MFVGWTSPPKVILHAGRFVNKFRSNPTSLWPHPAKSSVTCACSEPWLSQKAVEHTRSAEAPDEKRARLQAAGEIFINISKGTEQGYVLQTCKLIVWDEATTSHRNAFHALEKTLQDFRGSSSIMGGATVVLAGDFRQTLPIVTRGTPADEINACLKNSYLWHHVEKFSLTTNMRSHIQGGLSAGQFANKLLQIGDGKVPEDPSTGLIIMPCGQFVNSPDELLSKVFPNIQQNFKDQDKLPHRAILASRNDVVEKLNVTIQKQLPGQEYAYKSIDCTLNDDEAVQYPIEFLNSIQSPDLQAHI
ncbi:ATP-dependent DNA helicase [Trichonephila clavipes]|nr:ATP-dependent DNA helicase [Trichonephila clavipes]